MPANQWIEDWERLAAEEEKRATQRRADLRAAGATDDEVRAIVDDDNVVRRVSLDASFASTSAADILANHRAVMVQRAVEQRAWWRTTLREMGAPELHLRHVFDREPNDGAALKAARRFLDEKDALFLLLAGGVGTHKTGAAIHVMDRSWSPRNHEDRRPPSMRFLPADKIAKLGGFEHADELEKLERVSLLVIDDLGAEFGDSRGWALSLFAALVNARYGAALRTVITTNLDAPQIKTQYGERVADRIRETGIVHEVAGTSLRRRRGEATR